MSRHREEKDRYYQERGLDSSRVILNGLQSKKSHSSGGESHDQYYFEVPVYWCTCTALVVLYRPSTVPYVPFLEWGEDRSMSEIMGAFPETIE
jgi:hypothetical protein